MKNLFRRRSPKPARQKPHHPPGPCLNCGTHLSSHDLFCPNCGQKRLDRADMSFRHMIGESFLDYFHFDSRFFRTIRPFIFKPGWLTMEYMKGKRRSFLEPFKLFLVISVVYFLLLPLGGESTYDQGQPEADRSSATPGKSHNLRPFKYSMKGASLSITQQDSIVSEIDSIGLKAFVDKNFANNSWAVKLLMKQLFKILVFSGQSFTTTLEHTASKMIFLLIPVFALILSLFYRGRERLYFEHLIFSLHTHAFVFLLLIVFLLIGFLVEVKTLIPILISVVYLFFALKTYFGESILRTLWKLILLLILYCIIALPVFLMLLLLVAVFLF